MLVWCTAATATAAANNQVVKRCVKVDGGGAIEHHVISHGRHPTTQNQACVVCQRQGASTQRAVVIETQGACVQGFSACVGVSPRQAEDRRCICVLDQQRICRVTAADHTAQNLLCAGAVDELGVVSLCAAQRNVTGVAAATQAT